MPLNSIDGAASRHRQLFQDRYKSNICQEDPYLLELVRRAVFILTRCLQNWWQTMKAYRDLVALSTARCWADAARIGRRRDRYRRFSAPRYPRASIPRSVLTTVSVPASKMNSAFHTLGLSCDQKIRRLSREKCTCFGRGGRRLRMGKGFGDAVVDALASGMAEAQSFRH